MILATWWDNIGGDYHRFSFVLAVIVSIMAICVSVLILKRYIEKKTRIAGLLAGFLITLSLAFVLDPIFLLIRGFMGIDLVEFQSLFSLGWTSFANVFLVYFLKEYFYDNQDHWAVKPIAIGAASVLPCVMIMYVIGGPAVIFLILHLIISFPLYLYQFIKSRAIVKMLEKEEEVDILASKGFKYVGLSGLAMFLTLVFLIFNEVTLVFPDFFMSIGLLKEDASIFVGIGVIFGGLAAIFYYIGFIMPEWIRNRWLQQAEQKK
jgi:hypothetical protein